MTVQVLDRRRVLVIDGPHCESHRRVIVKLLDELDGRGWQIVGAEEIKLPPTQMPTERPMALPTPVPPSYGPPRKGTRGKVRRW